MMQNENEETRSTEVQASHDTYLVCPLRDDEVEAIRAEAYKFREENFPRERRKPRQSTDDLLSELEEERRLRESGEFVPDSGISINDPLLTDEDWDRIEAINDPLSSTQFVRKELYRPLNRQQMHGIVAWYYGWEKWSEDPWGSYPKFCEWTSSIRDNEMAVWAVNETSMGRDYLVYGILEVIDKVDYSEVTEEGLMTDIGVGAAAFLLVKRHTAWESFEDFVRHYPNEALPARLVNERVSKVYPFDLKLPGLTVKADGTFEVHQEEIEEPFDKIEDFLSLFFRNYGPFTRYRILVSDIYLWYFALIEAHRRAQGHPELEAFLNYHTATDTHVGDLCRELAPKGYRFPDKNEAWGKLEQALEKRLKTKAAKYDDVYPIRSEHHDILKESYVAAEEGLLEGVNYWKTKAGKGAIAGLKGQLGNSLLMVVKNDLEDAGRKEKRVQKRQLLEKDYQGGELKLIRPDGSAVKAGRRKRRGSDEVEEVSPLFDEIPAFYGCQEEAGAEPVDLTSLGLDLDKLTPKERWVLSDVLQGFGEGHSFDSKKGLSFAERWGKDYGKNIKAYNRAKTKLKQS